MSDGDAGFFWGIGVGVFFTIVGQKVWALWGSALINLDIPGKVIYLLRGAS